MTLATREACAAQRDSLIKGHPVADLRRLPDHHTAAVIDEKVTPDLGRRMYLDPGRDSGEVGKQPRDEGDTSIVKRVRSSVGEDCVHSRVARQDLDRPDPARG